MKGHYNAFGRLLVVCARCVLWRWRVDGADAVKGPAVFVVHHQDLYGPLHATPLLPQEPRLWALGVFFQPGVCFRHFYGYTLTKRLGWPRPLAVAGAGVMAVVMPVVLRSIRAIAVYRGKSLRVGETMRDSARALEEGRCVLLCPDRDYSNPDAGVGEIYTGFLHLEKRYYRQTGRHLPFVPVHCCRAKKTMYVGKAVCFPDGAAYQDACDEVAQELVGGLNALARAAGDMK